MTWHSSNNNCQRHNFNPHLPCGRWRCCLMIVCHSCNFNPHLPCGRWRMRMAKLVGLIIFQSTPSLRKVTTKPDVKTCYFRQFQSTPSLRKVTQRKDKKTDISFISIHTFLAEGDVYCLWCWLSVSYFNPHLPCGRWRDVQLSSANSSVYFNPHLPCGRWRWKPNTYHPLY